MLRVSKTVRRGTSVHGWARAWSRQVRCASRLRFRPHRPVSRWGYQTPAPLEAGSNRRLRHRRNPEVLRVTQFHFRRLLLRTLQRAHVQNFRPPKFQNFEPGKIRHGSFHFAFAKFLLYQRSNRISHHWLISPGEQPLAVGSCVKRSIRMQRHPVKSKC